MIVWLAFGGGQEGGKLQLSHTLSLSRRRATNIGETISVIVVVCLKFAVSASDQNGLRSTQKLGKFVILTVLQKSNTFPYKPCFVSNEFQLKMILKHASQFHWERSMPYTVKL